MLGTDNMKAIISLCHQHRIPVIVDEAHGSHIRFLEADEYQGEYFVSGRIAI